MAQLSFNLLDWVDGSWTTRALEPLMWPALLILWARDFAPPAANLAASVMVIVFVLLAAGISLASAFMVRAIRRGRGDTRPVLQRIQDYHRDDESLLVERLGSETQPLPQPPAWLRAVIFWLGRPLSTTSHRIFWGLAGLLFGLAIYNTQSTDLSAWLLDRMTGTGLSQLQFSRWDLAMALTLLVFVWYLWLWACRTRAEIELRGTA